MQESIAFCGACIQCRRKESSRSLSHLLISFLFYCSHDTLCDKRCTGIYNLRVYTGMLFMFKLANCLVDGTTRLLRAMDEDSSQLAAVN